MTLEKISLLSLTVLYYKHLYRDFPAEERRPLHKILRLMALGRYSFRVMRSGEETVAYAALAKTGEDLMLDYLAVCRGKRNNGCGSRMLSLLEEEFSGKTVFVEVEDPDGAEGNEDRETRIRRLRFYLRAGFRDSGIRCDVYGVRFMILLKGTELSYEEAVQRLDRIYRAVFTPKAYAEHIRYLNS